MRTRPRRRRAGEPAVQHESVAIRRLEPTQQRDTHRGESRQVEVATTGGDQRLRPPHDGPVSELVRPLTPESGCDQPIEGFPATVSPPVAANWTGREVHPPTRQGKVLGDLPAGLSAPDDEHRPVRQGAGAAVARRVQLEHVIGERVRKRGEPGDVQTARGQHHGIRQQLVVRCPHREAGTGVLHGHDLRARPHRQRRRLGRQHGDDLVAPRERGRRHLAHHVVHPAGGVEPEAVPPLGCPRSAGLGPLEHDVVDAPSHQGLAHGQARRTATDHHAWRSHVPTMVRATLARQPAVPIAAVPAPVRPGRGRSRTGSAVRPARAPRTRSATEARRSAGRRPPGGGRGRPVGRPDPRGRRRPTRAGGG